MKKSIFKRVVTLTLALVMVLALVACGGGGNTTNNNNTDATKSTHPSGKEHVTLSMYTRTTSQPGMDEMIEALNEYLLEKLNVTLDLRLSTDYDSTMGTRIDAGDDWDICMVGLALDLQSYARRNAFASLNDYLDLAPKTMEQLRDDALPSFSVDGEVYAIPILKDVYTRYAWTINQSLLDDLGVEFPEFGTKMDLVDFFFEVKEARDAKYPEKMFDPLVQDIFYDYDQWIVGERLVGGWNKPIVDVNIDSEYGYDGIQMNDTAFCPVYTPEYREIMKTVRKLVENDIGAFDPKSFDQDNVLLNSGALLGSCGTGLLDVAEDVNPNYKSKLYPSTITYSSSYKYGFAINAKCENIDRAVEVLELLQTDTYAATTLHFGKEGSSWTDVDNDGVIELTEKNSNPNDRWWYNWNGWILGGFTSMKVPPGLRPDYTELTKQMNLTAKLEPNSGFVFDKEPVENELAAVSNVYAEYHSILQTGQNANVDELVDEFISELKANGMDAIVAEAQRQLDAWRAENGK